MTKNKIIQFSILFILIFIGLEYSFCQSSGCYYVKEKPVVFQQDSLRKVEAKKIIQQLRGSEDINDTLTLIGVPKEEILDDLNYNIEHPNSIVLNDSGYYCGVAVVLNWLLNNCPDAYVKAVIDLTFYGQTRFNNGSRKIKLPKRLQKKVDYSWISEKDKKNRADIGTISISNFVLGVSLVSSEKVIQKIGLLWNNSTHRKSSLGNYLFANTMPWEIDDYFRLVGVFDMKKSYYSPFENEDKILLKLSSAVNSGCMPIFLENHLLTADRYKNVFYKTFGGHFISVHEFEVHNECNTISISYWDYGKVMNYREKGDIAAKSIRIAIRSSNRITKIKEGDKYLEITKEQFFKGLKGYWLPNF